MFDPTSLALLRFITAAHGKQTRKYTGLPYLEHLFEVAEIVARWCPDNAALVYAALLHDVVEDTPFQIRDLEQTFPQLPPQTFLMVAAVTDPESSAPRSVRKAETRARVVAAGDDACILKLADLLSNGASFAEHDPHFFRVFYHEAMAFHEDLITSSVPLSILDEFSKTMTALRAHAYEKLELDITKASK